MFQCCSVFCNNKSASQRLYFISNRVGSLKHSHPQVRRGSRRSTEADEGTFKKGESCHTQSLQTQLANFLLLTRFSAVLWHIHNINILFKEASCEEKRPWCCRRPIKTWQNRHLSTYTSHRSLKSSVKACILLSLSSLLLLGLQTVKLIDIMAEKLI